MMVIRRQVDYERFVLEGDGSGVVDGWCCGWCFCGKMACKKSVIKQNELGGFPSTGIHWVND